ncbi:hypothetical protein [Coralliovum pocilloporae]|uniref:hypothetical protein n=1 Tax=Coralliovum pocilloporae TaxID=3066369 RepID=UPI003307111A
MRSSQKSEGICPSLSVAQSQGVINEHEVLALLRGQRAGLHISGAFSEKVGNTITNNYMVNPGRKERKDGVAGSYLGSSHFLKEPSEYYQECASSAADIDALLGDQMDPVRSFFFWLRHVLSTHDIKLERSRSVFGTSNYCRALAWTGEGDYSLAPHDDLAQVLWAGSGFDFQTVSNHNVIAVNFYANAPIEGGDLRLWNFKPGIAERQALGVEKSGYPYQVETLEDYESYDFRLRTGDIALIDGGYVHGVTKQTNSSGEPRLLLHCFIGFSRPDLVLWWT